VLVGLVLTGSAPIPSRRWAFRSSASCSACWCGRGPDAVFPGALCHRTPGAPVHHRRRTVSTAVRVTNLTGRPQRGSIYRGPAGPARDRPGVRGPAPAGTGEPELPHARSLAAVRSRAPGRRGCRSCRRTAASRSVRRSWPTAVGRWCWRAACWPAPIHSAVPGLLPGGLAADGAGVAAAGIRCRRRAAGPHPVTSGRRGPGRRRGESEEFVAMREYRRGDSLRRVHWRSTARLGELVVKEYQDEYFVRHALVLDTFCEASRDTVFEEPWPWRRRLPARCPTGFAA